MWIKRKIAQSSFMHTVESYTVCVTLTYPTVIHTDDFLKFQLKIWSVPYCLQPLVHLTWKLFCPSCRRYSPWRMAISSIFLHIPSLEPGIPHFLLQQLHLEISCRHTQLCTSLSFFSLFFQQPVLGNSSPSGLSLFFIKLISGLFWQQHLLVFFFSRHFLTAAAFFCLYSSNCPEVFNFSTKRFCFCLFVRGILMLWTKK